MSESSSSLHLRSATQLLPLKRTPLSTLGFFKQIKIVYSCLEKVIVLPLDFDRQGLEFSKAFHKHYSSLLLWLLALFGSQYVVKLEEMLLIAIGEMSILYFGAHLWIIQRTVDRSSRHLKSDCTIVLLASVIFGMLIYSNVESPMKWLVILTFPCIVPATDPDVLRLVLEGTRKVLKHVVEVASWAFERSRYKLSPWIARRTTSSLDGEVSRIQEVGHDERNSGDDAPR